MIVHFFMRLHAHDIVPIQQPVQLLASQAYDLLQCLAGPFKPVPLQALLPQAKTIAFPVQRFNLVTLAVAEYKQIFGEWIQCQGAFDRLAGLTFSWRATTTSPPVWHPSSRIGAKQRFFEAKKTG